MADSTVSNIGQKASFFCMNGHPEPIKMVIKEGNNQFYACSKYMVKDEKHPDGYDPDFEKACNNRLSFDDAGDVIMKFSEILAESLMNGEMNDWTNIKFKVKQIDVKILRYSDKHIDFGVVNKRAVKR